MNARSQNPSLQPHPLLEDRVAIVTGSSRGIGLAIAQALSAEGCSVVLCARGETALSRAEGCITHAGGVAFSVCADLTHPTAARQVVARTLRRFGRIDILVNNAGGLSGVDQNRSQNRPLDRPFLKLTDADWRKTLELNLMTAVRACRAVIPEMQKQRTGRIINIASTAGIDKGAKYPDYRIAKSGLIALGAALSAELAPDGIGVNTVCPGPVWTPSWEREARMKAKREGVPVEGMTQAIQAGVASTIPMGRMGHVDEVARLVAFLASPQTTWMTGAVIRIDGGGAQVL